MKSRVINTKHFDCIENEKTYIGYTSKLKPSLFFGNKPLEGYLWVQDFTSNKMSKWELIREEKDEEKILRWTYAPNERFIAKFPQIEGWKLIVHFDSRKIKELAFNKYKKISEEYVAGKTKRWDFGLPPKRMKKKLEKEEYRRIMEEHGRIPKKD